MKRPWYAVLALPLLLLVPHGSTPLHRPPRAVLLFSAPSGVPYAPTGAEQTDPGDWASQLGAIQAEADAQAARDAAATAEAARQTRPVQASTAPLVGSCCGPHTDAWWLGVAHCEENGVNDPFYGYFGKIDGAWGGLSWEEQVTRGNALLAAVGHEIGTWAQRCVEAGYAASPGG